MTRRPRFTVQTEIAFSSGVQDIMNSLGGEATTRELMLLATIDEMVFAGPVDFSSANVCERLNVKVPMINHYFGSRDGLLAEATLLAYRSWSHKLAAAVKSAPNNPEKRLRAFIASELDWATKMKAVGVLIQYPLLSESIRNVISEHHAREMNDRFEYHLALLSVIIVDMRHDRITELNFDETNYPRKEYLFKYPAEVIDATSVAWSIHGLALWHSESHTATREIAMESLNKLSRKIAVNNHIDNILKIARGK